MSRFLKPSLAALEAYVPGEQPQDRKYIKLNTNESPYPPPQSVAAVLNAEEAAKLRLYSDPESRVLKERLARNYGRAQAEVFVSNGSDEILNFAFMAYGEQGVRFADITYGFYSVFADLYGLDAEVIPLREDFSSGRRSFLRQGRTDGHHEPERADRHGTAPCDHRGDRFVEPRCGAGG